jgi:hypothetical protein
MRAVLLLFLSLLCHESIAAPPSCYPGEASASDVVPTVIVSNQGMCAVWWCDVNHKWARVSICGTYAEATPTAISAIRAAFALSKAEKDALWTQTFTTPVVPLSDDYLLLNRAAMEPAPTKAPPSGLVTQDIKVYKLNQTTNGAPAFSLVGTVALGVRCDASQNLNGYYRIDRTLVKFAAGTIMPLTTWANCTP